MTLVGSLLLLGVGSKALAAADSPLDSLTGVTGAWSPSRQLLSAWGSANYTLTSGNFSQIADQTGNSRNFNDGGISTRPAPGTIGGSSRLTAEFDGSSDWMVTAAALSTFVSNSTKFIYLVCKVNSSTLNSANAAQNDILFSDGANKFCGLFSRHGPTTDRTLYAYNWDGTSDQPGVTHTEGQLRVLWLRHEGGTLALGVDGTETTASSGNTSTMTNTLALGGVGSGSWSAMSFCEAFTATTVPDSAARAALLAGAQAYYG